MRLPGRHVGFALAAAAVALSVSAVLPHRTLVPHAHAASAADEGQSFGDELVWAARWQTWIPVIYNPSYAQIPYPNGDVAWYYGVCTDVIVRAYRWMGIDLQVEVKRSGAGSGDGTRHRWPAAGTRHRVRVPAPGAGCRHPGSYTHLTVPTTHPV